MILTKLGEGAKRLLDPEQSLLGADGLPRIVGTPPKKIKSEPLESLTNDTPISLLSIKKEMLEESEQSLSIASDPLNELAPEDNIVASALPTTSETPSN